jgi:hypothetical protein
MTTDTVILELPIEPYNKLQKLAVEEETDPIEIIARLIEASTDPISPLTTEDPFFEIIGAYHSDRPLIDNIPVSEDPDLYLAAAALGEQAIGLHAWEIAPARYQKGPGGHPVRRFSEQGVDEAEE